MSNVGSVDSSAAAWAEATLSAAEAYAQAEADAAGEARDQTQKDAASGVQPDGMDRPPTAEERAADTFWKNDPNRPAASTVVAGPTGSGSDGERDSVQLTSDEVKAFQEAGMTVTP